MGSVTESTSATPPVPTLCICANFNYSRTKEISDIIGRDLFPEHCLCFTDPETEFAEIKASGKPIVLAVLGPMGYRAIKFLGDDYEKPQAERRLKWVHCCSAGLDFYRLHELEKEVAGVPITNVKGGYNYLLAQHVLFSILYFARQTARQQLNRREKKWDPFELVEARGQKIVILGYGEIGRESARLLQPLGMDITGVRRTPSSEPVDEFGVKLVSGDAERDRLICESDYLINILPLTKDTTGLFNAARFATMKPTAIYINIGRGGTQVDVELAEALQKGVIAGAALDVFQQEPLPASSPLWDVDDSKILLTSHNASMTPESFYHSQRIFCKYAEDFLKTGQMNAYQPDIYAGY